MIILPENIDEGQLTGKRAFDAVRHVFLIRKLPNACTDLVKKK